MILYGLQKTTLLDFPGKVACTVFTGGCNFRCPFCHNSALIFSDTLPEDTISEDEFFSFLSKRHGILDGVAITGGEPLLRDEIFDFIKKIRSMDFLVKLDTNGSFPERLEKIINEGLADYIAMDIKNSRENYGKAIGIENYDTSRIEKSVSLLMNNKIPYEFRTTVVKGIHEEKDFESIGQWLDGAENLFLQTFKDSGNILTEGMDGFGKNDEERFAEILRKHIKTVEIRGL